MSDIISTMSVFLYKKKGRLSKSHEKRYIISMKNPIKQTSLKEDAGKVLVDIDERSECRGRACTDMTERVRTSKGFSPLLAN